MFSLYAERETDRRRIASVRDRAEAEETVDALEFHGLWPEGYDAVFEQGQLNRWLYTDGAWERVL